MKCASCRGRRARAADSATPASELIYFFADAGRRDRDSEARPVQGGGGLRPGESAALRPAVVGGGVSAARRREERRHPAHVSARGRGAGAADQASAAGRRVDAGGGAAAAGRGVRAGGGQRTGDRRADRAERARTSHRSEAWTAV